MSSRDNDPGLGRGHVSGAAQPPRASTEAPQPNLIRCRRGTGSGEAWPPLNLRDAIRVAKSRVWFRPIRVTWADARRWRSRFRERRQTEAGPSRSPEPPPLRAVERERTKGRCSRWPFQIARSVYVGGSMLSASWTDFQHRTPSVCNGHTESVEPGC